MSETQSAGRRIADKVTSWEGVTSGIGSRGEQSFKVGGREIGHLHGNTVAHFFFNKPLWQELRRAGRISYHPVFPDREGPAARRILTDEDADDVIRLMRLNYDITIDRLNREAVRSATSEGERLAGVADQQHLTGLVERTAFRAGMSPVRLL
ncbi:MAG: luciferase family protein [Rhizobiaceae bacterium]